MSVHLVRTGSLRSPTSRTPGRPQQSLQNPSVIIGDVLRWLALLFIPLAAAAGDRWIEIRSGPFQIVTNAGDRGGREALNQLEQVRYLLGTALGSQDLKTLWPVRIVIAKSIAPTVPVWTRDTYTGAFPVDSPMPPACLREVVRILIESNAGRMPAGTEAGLADFFSTAQASGPKVTLGAPPPAERRTADWARIDLLQTDPNYAGRLHVLLYNLQHGGDLQPAMRNAFGKSPAEIDRQAAAMLAAGNFPTVTVGARALDPKRDFTPQPVEGPLASIALADLGAAYQPLLPAAPAEAHEGLGLLALREQRAAEALQELTAAVEAGSTSARAWLEHARLIADTVKAKAELEKTAKLNSNWAEPYVVLATLETDPARRLQWLKTAASLEPRNAARWSAVAEVYQRHNMYPEAAKAWAAAEDNSLDEAGRERIGEVRHAIEQQRLDYQAAERKRIEDEKQRDIERVKAAAMAKIHAAEESANRANPRANPAGKVENMAISDAAPARVEGTLVQVDCLGRVKRLAIRDAGQKEIRVLIRDPKSVVVSGGDLALKCGPLRPPRAVSIDYQPKADPKLGAAGDVVAVTYP